ncbi:MAG: tRNA 2-thiouridine(34) synthase MnmA, partial [Deltaproteobacteria bacterium]|nr:tRNA 2-thiouridine(34) synthase MnmA [Deltaproteobacteria bacterium]
QTYFLYATPYEALSRILFPLGELTKAEVRSIALKAGLPVAEKAESQDLCFVDRQNYPDFVAQRMKAIEPGPIVDQAGQQLGMHRGIVYYTIGQRSGLGIAYRVPLYVVAIDAAENRLIVGEKSALNARGLVAGDLNILTTDWPAEVEAKIRYRRKPALCDVAWESGKINVLFREEEEAITPGQAVVFYQGDYVLGGGAIEEVLHGTC